MSRLPPFILKRHKQAGPSFEADCLKIIALQAQLRDAKAERERLLEKLAELDVTIHRIPLAINHIADRADASLNGKVKYFSDAKRSREEPLPT